MPKPNRGPLIQTLVLPAPESRDVSRLAHQSESILARQVVSVPAPLNLPIPAPEYVLSFMGMDIMLKHFTSRLFKSKLSIGRLGGNWEEHGSSNI